MEKEKDLKLEELEDEDAIIELEDEDGNVLNFYHIATFPFEGKDYVVFQPAEEYDAVAEDEVVIYELQEGEDGDDIFQFIEDDAQLDKVFNEFMRIVDETCDCEGDDCDCKSCDKK